MTNFCVRTLSTLGAVASWGVWPRGGGSGGGEAAGACGGRVVRGGEELVVRASAWTNEKVEGVTTKLDAPTPCDEWDVRTLMNHMLETQRYFVNSARGEDASLSPNPPALLGDDPAAQVQEARDDTLRTFGEPGVIETTGPALGIAFSDQLLHGWDLAVQ